MALLLAVGHSMAQDIKETSPANAAPAAVSSAPAALSFPGETIDSWHGLKRHRFKVDGCEAWVVEPQKALPGKPLSWCM
ncbi:MAG: hypothetical protein EOP86_22785, partial [Verrucomicrobiaceae bacterium]